MAIIMAGRKWTAQYEFYAHRRLALEAGLSPAIADAIAANQRCGIGSCGVPRPSLGGYVTGTAATREVPVAGGR